MGKRPISHIAITLIIFVGAFLTLAVGSYTQKSATFDEPVHLADGYVSLTRHDYRVDPEHPPLARMLASLPLLADRGIHLNTAAIEEAAPTDWALVKLFDFTHQFLYVDNDADRLLYPARFMIALLGALLGVLLFFWILEWLGFWPAVIGLALYLVEPNIAAHSSLVTTDMPVTCFIFGAVYFLWRVSRRPASVNVAAFVMFAVLAILTKFSALILVPIVVVLLAVSIYFRQLTFRSSAMVLALLTLASFVGIWGIYGFRYAPSASQSWLFRFQDVPDVRARIPLLTDIVAWVDGHRLLPNVFTQGFLIGQAKAQERSAFLAGSYATEGWWYFFPVAFLIKTPISLLLLLCYGLIAAPKPRDERATAAFAVVPMAIIMTSAMGARLNIGLRHILPIYPFVLLVAAVAVRDLIGRRRRLGRWTLAGVIFFAAIDFARTYPDNLTFFNQFVGGPVGGARYLVDSSLDWGQDLKPLKLWMDSNGVKRVNLAYFGSADPAYYHIDCTYLPGSPVWLPPGTISRPRLPGYVAVSVTTLSGVYADARSRDFYKPLLGQVPLARIGNSIYVYWVDRPWR